MVYELLQNCFVFNDSINGFDLFFEICKHIVCGHVHPSVSRLLVAFQVLVLEKQVRGVRPIAVEEVIYWLITCKLVIQFKHTFAKHYCCNLSLGLATKARACKGGGPKMKLGSHISCS